MVDTVLAKIYSEEEKTAELYSLLRSPNCILLSELEPVLIRTGQYNALCILYKERGEDQKLLEVWARCVSFLAVYSRSLI